MTFKAAFSYLWASRTSGLVLLSGLFFFFTWQSVAGISNPDTFFHLRVGEELASGNWKPWQSGHFNSLDSADWGSTQWLSQYLMYGCYKIGGLTLINVLAGLACLLLCFGIYAVTRQYCPPFLAGLLTISYAIAHSYAWGFRPQMLSFFLILYVIHRLLQAQRFQRNPWELVLIFWLWPNFHGMWIMGLGTAIVVLALLAYDRGIKNSLALGQIALASILATFVTPAGPMIWQNVLKITSVAIGDEWGEWGTPEYFTWPLGLSLAIILLTLGLALTRKNNIVVIGILGLSLIWALYSMRSAPAALLMTFPILGTLLKHKFRRLGAVELFVPAIVALSLTGLLALSVPNNYSKDFPVDPWVAGQVNALPEGTVVFSGFVEGSYLLYASPQTPLFVTGYADSFNERELERIYTIVDRADGWVEELKQTRATYAILPVGIPNVYSLEQLGWTIAQTGEYTIMLKAPENWLAAEELQP